MAPTNVSVLVGVENTRLRERILRGFERRGFQPLVLARARSILDVAPPLPPVVLETNDDAAAFTQIIYELYRLGRQEGNTLPVIGVFSKEAGRRNPALAFFNIDGHAAVAGMIPVGGREMEEALAEFVRRIAMQCSAAALPE